MNAQETFSTYAKKASSMTIEALRYCIEDCKIAAQNMRGFDAAAEGKYMDEMAAYLTELKKRKA